MKRKIAIKGIAPVCWLVVFVMIGSNESAYGEEVQSVETESSIGFIGKYEPIGTPDPIPPEGIIRPPVIGDGYSIKGTLPQTNMKNSHYLSWIGSVILCLVALIIKNKNKKQKEVF